MNGVKKSGFPQIRLQTAGLPRCPKCNSLLKKVVIKEKKKDGIKMGGAIIWGCLGWHSYLRCHTQYYDNNGTPDFNQELERCV
jgi:hypothetical protein